MRLDKTKEDILQDYYSKCGSFEVSIDNTDNDKYEVNIYTERFHAFSIYSDETKYELYPNKIKELYNVTFNDNEVMQRYAKGTTYTIESYEERINAQSLRVAKSYPFHGLLVCDRLTDVVVGYEIIGNGSNDHIAETAYVFRKEYQRSGEKRYVGFENVGALIWGYGEKLYKEGVHLINRDYDEELFDFTGGTNYKSILALVRPDNPASAKLLSNLGFEMVGKQDKLGHERLKYQVNFDQVQ